jgi:hypothetical protein
MLLIIGVKYLKGRNVFRYYEYLSIVLIDTIRDRSNRLYQRDYTI